MIVDSAYEFRKSRASCCVTLYPCHYSTVLITLFTLFETNIYIYAPFQFGILNGQTPDAITYF